MVKEKGKERLKGSAIVLYSVNKHNTQSKEKALRYKLNDKLNVMLYLNMLKNINISLGNYELPVGCAI